MSKASGLYSKVDVLLYWLIQISGVKIKHHIINTFLLRIKSRENKSHYMGMWLSPHQVYGETVCRLDGVG